MPWPISSPKRRRRKRECRCSYGFPRRSASLTKGNAEIQAKGDTIDSLVSDLERQYPGLKDRLLDESGELRRFINIYVNQEDIRFLQAKKTGLKDGDEVSIVPAIAGG